MDAPPESAWSLTADWTGPLRRRPALVAAGCAVVAAALALRIGARADLPAFLCLGVLGVLLGVVDTALKRLPEPLTLPGYGLGLVLLGAAAPFTDGGGARLLHALAGLAALGALFGVQWVVMPNAIGFGDVTLAGLLGLYLGWLGAQAWLLGVVATFVLSLATSLALLALRRAGRKTQIPYGPFLLGGALVAILAHAG
ncbi:prepilin peptidase [Spirillospora sp. NPDC050679]